MFDKIQNKILERHVKSKLKLWYAMQGIDLDKLEKMTYKEILNLLDQLVNGLQQENGTLKNQDSFNQNKINILNQRISKLEEKNKELQVRNENLTQSFVKQNTIGNIREVKSERTASLER